MPVQKRTQESEQPGLKAGIVSALEIRIFTCHRGRKNVILELDAIRKMVKHTFYDSQKLFHSFSFCLNRFDHLSRLQQEQHDRRVHDEDDSHPPELKSETQSVLPNVRLRRLQQRTPQPCAQSTHRVRGLRPVGTLILHFVHEHNAKFGNVMCFQRFGQIKCSRAEKYQVKNLQQPRG